VASLGLRRGPCLSCACPQQEREQKRSLNTFLGCSSNCSGDLTKAADTLAAASNKTLTTGTLNQLNSLLGVDTSTDATWGADSQSIVDQANAAE
jgi:hypothetical protein